MSVREVTRAGRACAQIAAEGAPVTFASVATRPGISRATLCRQPALRAAVGGHRARARDAHSLTGLVIQPGQLRHALGAGRRQGPPARGSNPQPAPSRLATASKNKSRTGRPAEPKIGR